MKLKILCTSLVFALAIACAPAQTITTSTMTCAPSDTLSQPIQNGPTHSQIAFLACSTTGSIGGVAFQGAAGAVYVEESATLYKAWGYTVVTLANGDQFVYAHQTTAAFRNGVLQPGQKTYQIQAGTGGLKGITGSGTCSVTYPPAGGSVAACSGTYKLP